MTRLSDAREQEAELFRTILHIDRKPGFEPGHSGYRNKSEPEQTTACRWQDK
jgi:hypothetical protein